MADAVMVSSSFLPGRGGIESYLAELCERLAPRLAVVAAEERDGKRLCDLDLPYPAYGAPTRMLMPGPRALKQVVDAARREGTNKVLFGTPWPLVLMGPRLKREHLHYGVIVHGAEMLVPSRSPGVKSRLAEALSEADLLLPVSRFTADKTSEFLRRAHRDVPDMDLLRAQVDLERFSPDAGGPAARQRLNVPPWAKVVLCFGRLVPRKGVDRLIKAMPQILRRSADALLVIAGTGPEERRLQRLTYDLGLTQRVRFTGRVPEAEAPATYAAADVFVLPVVDRWFGLEIEGLGIVLLEAAACGLPCVTGTSGGTPEAVVDGETGFVIDAQRQDELVDQVVWVLEHPDDAKRMGAAGREHVRQNFTARPVPALLTDWLS